MVYKFDGVPYNSVLNVTIEETEESKQKAIRYTEYFKKLVTSGITSAVIYIFSNGNVLQFCGGKDYFHLESVKIYGRTPNIIHLKALAQKNMTDKHIYTYCGSAFRQPLENMIASKELSAIIRYAIMADKTDYADFIDKMCEEFKLYKSYGFMTSEGQVKITVKE